MIGDENSEKPVLVTGATGFIGSNLVDGLLRRGYPVTCLVRNASDTHALQKQSVRLVVGNLDDPAALREAVSETHAIYHIAGAIRATGREEYFRINQTGTRRLLEAAAEVNPALSRFIHMSSLAAAGPSDGTQKLTEEAAPNPISWYGESKLGAEQEVLRHAGTFPVTILRPSAVYGPRDKATLLIFRMIRRGCLITPGRFVRRFSLIHVEDLVDGVIRAGECRTPSGQIYFLSRPEIYTWDDVGREAARSMGKPYRRLSTPKWLAQASGIAGDLFSRFAGRPAAMSSQKVNDLLQPSWLCDSSKARAAIGFNPGIDLERGIRATVLWYQAHGWL